MLSVRKRAWMIAASVVGMLAGAAQAADTVQWGVFSASGGDRLTGASQEAGNRYVLKTSAISVGDIEGLLASQKRTDTDLQDVNSKLDAQGREFDEFKRKNGSSSNASDSQLSDLKRTGGRSSLEELGRLGQDSSERGSRERQTGTHPEQYAPRVRGRLDEG